MNTIRFRQASEEFLHSQRFCCGDSTFRQQEKLLDRVCTAIGDASVDSLGRDAVIEFIKTHHTWSHSTKRRVGQLIARVLNSAGKPCDLRRAFPEQRTRQPELISHDKYTALLSAANEKLAHVLTVLWTTGAQAREIISATVDSIAETVDGLTLIAASGRRVHAILVPPKTAELIRQQAKVVKDGALFRNSKYTPWTASTLNANIVRACRNAEIEKLRLYDVRRTCAMRLLNKGVSPTVVATLLGHRNSLGVNRYLFTVPSSQLWEAASLLEE